MGTYCLLLLAYNSSYDAKTFHNCTLRTLCWLSNTFSLENSIEFPLFNGNMIDRRWFPKRGRFPILGGRCMFRREMRSKRGSLPPKEGDLTCMQYICHLNIAKTYTLLKIKWRTDIRWTDRRMTDKVIHHKWHFALLVPQKPSQKQYEYFWINSKLKIAVTNYWLFKRVIMNVWLTGVMGPGILPGCVILGPIGPIPGCPVK